VALNFDDYAIPTSEIYTTLPIPYNNFVFTGSSTSVVGWPNPGIPVVNALRTGYQQFVDATSSLPNFILTQGENLLFYQYSNQPFTLQSFTMATVYDPAEQSMFIQAYDNNSALVQTMQVTATRTPLYYVLGWPNVVSVLIGCVNPSLATCNFVVFDSFSVVL
jgi:hypothetical protein